MQRLRLKFRRGNELKFLSHLDMMRLWERAFRRAGMPPAHSEGFAPHPHISLAAPLPVGVIGDAELMDVFFPQHIPQDEFLRKIQPQLPAGIEISEVRDISVSAPSLQSLVRFAEYTVEVESCKDRQEIEAALEAMLSAGKFFWHHSRDTGERYYDLRSLIDNLWLIDMRDGICSIGMRLRCDASGSGRPEQVTRALGFAELPRLIRRTQLILA